MSNTTYLEDVAPIFHKTDIQIPPPLLDYVGIVVISGMTFLANAGGLGGGGLFIPFMMIFMRLSIFECVPLANIFGLIAALTRFIVNYKQRHPTKTWKVAIDYELIQLTMPMLYLGTLFGVKIGTTLTEVQLAISLECVLLFVTYKTFQKARQMVKKEKEVQLNKQQIELQQVKVEQTQNQVKKHTETQPLIVVPNQEQIGQTAVELLSIMEEEEKHFTLLRSLNFLATLIILFVTSMVVGNKYQKEPIVSKSVAYTVLLVFFVYSFASTIYNAKRLKKIHEIKQKYGYKYDPTDFKFDNNKGMMKIVFICFIAGCLGGIVGIAGGIILGPILLQMGMLPIVVAGTNQYLALISCISVSSQFMYMGVTNYEYTLYLGGFVIVSSYFGCTQVNRLIKLTGRQSIIVIILTVVLSISALSLPLRYLLK